MKYQTFHTFGTKLRASKNSTCSSKSSPSGRIPSTYQAIHLRIGYVVRLLGPYLKWTNKMSNTHRHLRFASAAAEGRRERHAPHEAGSKPQRKFVQWRRRRAVRPSARPRPPRRPQIITNDYRVSRSCPESPPRRPPRQGRSSGDQ